VPAGRRYPAGEKINATRIDTRLRSREGSRSAFVTFLMAAIRSGDLAQSSGAASGKRRHHRDRHALSPIRWPTARRSRRLAAALEGRHDPEETLAMVRAFREGDNATPLVLMGYYNPIYIYGVDKFLVDAKSAGIDGLIIVDLPPEEDTELCMPALKAGSISSGWRRRHRRQAVAGRARQHVRLCLLRLDHRHHRRRGGRFRAVGEAVGAHQAAYQPAGLCRLRHPHARGRQGNRRARQRRGGGYRAGRCLARQPR